MLSRLIILSSILIMTFGCAPTSESDSASSDAPLLRHVVLFKFKDSATPAQVDAIVEAFGELPSKIPSIVDYQWGTDVSIEGKANGFTHCFLVSFANDAGRAEYLPHPAHKAFVDLLLPSLDKGTVVDFFATDAQGATSTDGKLRHVVLFDFKDGTTDESLSAIQTKFTSLPADIPEIAAYEWGTNNSPEGLDDGYSHCFLVTFENEAGRAIYIPHPSHKEFGGIVRPNVEKVLVFDFFPGK
jgi:hypothetical protein